MMRSIFNPGWVKISLNASSPAQAAETSTNRLPARTVIDKPLQPIIKASITQALPKPLTSVPNRHFCKQKLPYLPEGTPRQDRVFASSIGRAYQRDERRKQGKNSRRLTNRGRPRELDRNALTLLGTREGHNFRDNFVHFGYRDNIMQPRFEGVHDPQRHADGQPRAPLGTVLLGHPTNLEGLTWRVPQPAALGHNGTFNAFRVLKQDVVGFEEYLDRAASDLLKHPQVEELLRPGAEAKIGQGMSIEGLSRHGALREIVAANLCGRWRDGHGTPLSLSADAPDPNVNQAKFDYVGESRCPYGAHIRRCNPRGGQIVQRIANNSRRLVWRGMPYGPSYDPAKRDRDKPEPERGLLGNFIGASLGAQFEAMSCDWLNLSLQDPRITGSNDPIAGANDPGTSWFDLQLNSGSTVRLRGLPRFVSTRGGAYTFLPSLSAIRFLGSQMM